MIKVIPEQRGHFLNEEQKDLKQKIMEGLFDVLQTTLRDTKVELNAQDMYDMITSCIIMFTRDTLAPIARQITEYELFITHVTDAIKKECIKRTLELKRELN